MFASRFVTEIVARRQLRPIRLYLGGHVFSEGRTYLLRYIHVYVSQWKVRAVAWERCI